MRIRPVKDELLHACGRKDEQTDRQTNRQDEANSRFSHFYENGENSYLVDRLINIFVVAPCILKIHYILKPTNALLCIVLF
jgi:hypothetical protein